MIIEYDLECEECGETEDIIFDENGTMICPTCFAINLSQGYYDE